ncbi:MAG: LacI family DNA-binding transcriptional regulator [Treponema sp.]|jgi:LacI family transcriptional regulator|nr:LacI family DNA-binding transcriptional regulator [Treponema sp.]
MPPRIIDIARAAEVSPAAVSLALNNKSGVSTGVRQKIIDIALSMGYQSALAEQYKIINENITIRLLKIAKHGHIINERHNAFITEYMEGIETVTKSRKYKLEVAFFNKAPIEDIIASQKGINVDGFIVLGTELLAHELDLFNELSRPIVFIDTYFPLSAYNCVDMDNIDGVFRSIQHLYRSGHRSIGLVKSSYETRNFKVRETGFREAMEYFSLPVQENFIVRVDPVFDNSVNDMNRFLDKHKNLPTAFFCMNDIIAYGCIRALRDHAKKIPDDISIIGFDDLPSSNYTEPPLTSIRVSTHQIGQRALERLAEQIAGVSGNKPETILIAGNLIERGSVKII